MVLSLGGVACAVARREGGSGSGPRVRLRGGHGRARLGPAAPRRLHPHRAPGLRHLRHRLQGLQEGGAIPPRGSPLCSPIRPPRSSGTPFFQVSAWGSAPIAPARHPLPLEGLLPSLPRSLRAGGAAQRGCWGGGSSAVPAPGQSDTREVVAIKCVNKRSLNRASVENLLTEIEILKTIRHPNIVELKDFQVGWGLPGGL